VQSRVAGIALLALLPTVATWVAIQGRRYDPGLYGFTPPERGAAGAAAPGAENRQVPSASEGPQASFSEAKRLIPESLLPPIGENDLYQASGAPAHYDRGAVYEKIDGAAPGYLELGFRELMTQAYASRAPDSLGCELFVYDMGSSENAGRIYRKQRGEGVEDAAVGDSAEAGAGCRFGATWFFHDGPYYVTVLNSDEGEGAERFSEALARGVAERIEAVSTRESGSAAGGRAE